MCTAKWYYLLRKTQARKIGNSIYLFLRDRLKLPINRAKSGIRKPVQFAPEFIRGAGLRVCPHV